MTEVGLALALVLVIEGLLWAGFTDLMRRAAAVALTTDPMQLRLGGLACAAVGVLLVWFLRS